MAHMDVFNNDAFSMVQLTTAVEKVPYQPDYLGALGIFEPEPIRTLSMSIEERQGVLSLIQTTPRGAPLKQRTTELRKIRDFRPPRIGQEDTIYAHEIQNIRAFGTESELMQVQAEAARRLVGPTGLRKQIEYTKENMRLGAIQGILLDADGSTLYNWFTEFGIAAPTEVAFDLLGANAGAGALRPIINGIVRQMARAAQGAWANGTRVHALCGDTFYDVFTNHIDVRATYLNWQAAQDLRDGTQGAAFESFPFAGVVWHNYRGSDDNTTIKIPDAKVKFFPVGAPGVFKEGMAPGESFDFANQPGKPEYVIMIPDRDRNAWVKFEMTSYPLYICTRPEILRTGRQGA